MAAIADITKAVVAEVTGQPTPVKIPPLVDDRIRRGREAKDRDRSHRRVCVKFWQGEHYWWVNDKGQLSSLPTVTNLADRSGKPPHRARTKRNFIHRLVENKVSAATLRTPGYSVASATTDPDDYAAAGLARKVAFAGYDKWMVRRMRIEAVTNALVQDGGYAMPYFDPNVAPFREVTDPETGETRMQGEGEIKLLSLDGNQVMWEPGCNFYQSPWWAIERAQPVVEIRRLPGFLGGKVDADADTADSPTDRRPGKLGLVTEYFERPSPEAPNGRKLTMHNGRVICEPEDYPVTDTDGTVVDEPVLFALTYTIDPTQDQDRGLVTHLLDPQRTVNDGVNKQIEWKNRGLNPQMTARRGSNVTRKTDAPGEVIEYTGQDAPTWEKVPPIPPELRQMVEDAISHMREIAADTHIEADPDVAARTAQAAIEHALSGWAMFMQSLADFDSQIMRRCLTLVAKHYSEERIMEIRGEEGWEPVVAFRGADLRSQRDVRVLADSLVPLTRQATLERVQFLVEHFPGAFTPEAVAAAIEGGTAQDLIRSYEYDVARARHMVRLMQGPPEQVMGLPVQPDGTPGWMPREQDNVDIHKMVVGNFMKSPAYDNLPVENKEVFNLYYAGLNEQEMRRKLREAQLQEQMAQQYGMANAAKPQLPPPPPDRPKPDRAA